MARIASLAVLLLLGGVAAAADVPQNDGRSWPTLHGDLTRSGFYPHFPGDPLKLVWRKELHRELTGTRCEVIVGRGLAFMGTYAGNMYAWDAATGEDRWKVSTGGPIGHSPMLWRQTLFFGSMDGRLYAVRVEDGSTRWTFQAEEGIWTSPAVHDGRVLFGDRAGVFYALDADDGRVLWTFRTGDRILAPASLSNDGRRVIFASEDMHVYCLDAASGKLNWKSGKLAGLSLRDHGPPVAGDLVLVTTNPVRGFHETLDTHQRLLLEWAGADPSDRSVDYRYLPGTDEHVAREQDRIVAWLREHPEEQTFYALRLSDGGEPWIAPLFYTCGLHNPMTPPCFNPATHEVYVYVRSAYGVWDGGGEVRPLAGVGKLDLATGRVNLLVHGHRSKEPGRPAGRKDMPWMTFNTIGDETQTLSLSADTLFSNHQGFLGSMDLRSGLTKNKFGKRDTYGGFYGPGNFGWANDGGVEKARRAGQPFGIVNEWHGPDKAIVSVADGRVYFPVGSQVLCLEGKP